MSKQTSTLPSPASSTTTSAWKAAVSPRPDGPTQKVKSVLEQAIRVRAYQIWEAAGRPAGDGVRFWLEAERELLQGK
jgi:hypothetical protein